MKDKTAIIILIIIIHRISRGFRRQEWKCESNHAKSFDHHKANHTPIKYSLLKPQSPSFIRVSFMTQCGRKWEEYANKKRLLPVSQSHFN